MRRQALEIAGLHCDCVAKPLVDRQPRGKHMRIGNCTDGIRLIDSLITRPF